jgi:hypothetical protein
VLRPNSSFAKSPFRRAFEGIANTSVRVDLETFDIAGGRAELLSTEHIETFSRRQLVACDEGAPTQ